MLRSIICFIYIDKFLRNYMKYEISRGTQVKIRRFKSHNWYASRRPQSSPGV
ncbi:unnamed protein product, partial [Nesidiocoris tenuis]